eukprot:14066772-Ditylum_brightwellii.AAC.1
MMTAMRSKVAAKNDKEGKNDATSKPNLGKCKSEEKSNVKTRGKKSSKVMEDNNKGKSKTQYSILL